MNFQHIDNFFPGNFSGSYTFNSYADFAANRPFSFTQAFAGANTDGPLSTPNVNEYAFYAQDSWRVSEQLTLNYGIRYDFFDLAHPKVKNPDPGLAAANLDTSLIPIDKNNVGGRFGFAYRLTQNGNTVLRGGFGNYYGRTPSILTGTAFTQNGIQVQTYTLTANLPAYPNILSGAAGIEPHARYLCVRQGLRAAADLAVEPESGAPARARLRRHRSATSACAASI